MAAAESPTSSPLVDAMPRPPASRDMILTEIMHQAHKQGSPNGTLKVMSVTGRRWYACPLCARLLTVGASCGQRSWLLCRYDYAPVWAVRGCRTAVITVALLFHLPQRQRRALGMNSRNVKSV